MRYGIELLLAFSLVALVMTPFLRVAMQPDSAAQNPERLWRDAPLMFVVFLAAGLMSVLRFLDLPGLHALLTPTAPPQLNVP